MDTYRIKFLETGLRSGYFIGTELTVTKAELDRIKENNQVEILEEIKAVKKKLPNKSK
jgi:hypothetical protein